MSPEATSPERDFTEHSSRENARCIALLPMVIPGSYPSGFAAGFFDYAPLRSE
jgi:hypothetical protein